MVTRLGWRPNLDGHHDVSLDLLLHVSRRTEQVLARTAVGLDEATDDAAAVRSHQQATRDAVLAGFGDLPQRPEGPPPTRWRGPQEGPGCVVEHLVYASSPGVHVTATLYRPGTGTGRRPAVLFVCGHTPDGRAAPEYQQVCARLARAGLVVLAIDPEGQGERLGYLDAEHVPLMRGTVEHSYAGMPAWWLGQSIARWFVHDARRAVDLLVSLPDVDPDRIGITGNSGGGTLTTWMLALEDRLAAAAVGTFVTSRGVYLWSGQSQDAEQVLPGGTARGVDHADLLAAFAPRPLAVLAVDFDFFPMEGTLESIERAGAAYRTLGAAAALELHTAPFPHRYPPPLAHAAARFFCAAFGLPEPELDDLQEPLPAAAMRAVPSGQVALDHQDALFVHDLIRAEADLRTPPEPGAARTWVEDRVRAHRQWPRAPFARWLAEPEGHHHGMWRSERDLWGAGVLLRSDPAPTDGPRPLRILLLDGGTGSLTGDHPAVQGARTDAVLAVDVRGRGALAPHDKDALDPRSHRSAVFKLLCDLLWLDDSLAAGQVFDVTRAIDVALADPHLATLLPGLGPDSPVHVEADGVLGFVAKLAAVVDERITTVRVTDDVVDPDRMLTEQHWDDGRGAWQAIIPGLAQHAPLPVIHEILGERLH